VGADRTNVGDCFNLFGIIDIPFKVEDKNAPCMNPWYCLGIYYDGRANFCLQDCEGDDTAIGSCKENTVAELWNNKRAQEIRLAVSSMDYDRFPPCKKCNVNVYHRYQLKPFFEYFVDYAQRMKTIDSLNINMPQYLYLSHLQSIKSGAMLNKNKELSLKVINEVIERIKPGTERFYDVAKEMVRKYGRK